jgi:hypothetical protein
MQASAPRAPRSPTRGGAAVAKGGDGGLANRGDDVGTDRELAPSSALARQALSQAGGLEARYARNPFRARRRGERRECVLCDEYAYIRSEVGGDASVS